MATITFRTDEAVDAALERLRAEGKTQSDVIRQAILDADRAVLIERIKAEAAEIMADPEQVAITMEVNRYMDSIRAW